MFDLLALVEEGQEEPWREESNRWT
jgi:hypothetical protein